MRIIIGLALIMYSFSQVYGQEDTKAQKILDDLTLKFKSYPSVSIDFSATVSQLQGKDESTSEGKLWVKGSKYKLEIQDQVIFFDGKRIYQYMPEVKEVNVSEPDMDSDNEDLQLLNPQTFFNLSSKSFKSKLVKEDTYDKRKVYEIDLYPIQVKTTRYSRIRMMIERETLQIVFIKAFFKDGAQYSISFKPYNILSSLPDSYFTFNRVLYPDVEVIDLSF